MKELSCELSHYEPPCFSASSSDLVNTSRLLIPSLIHVLYSTLLVGCSTPQNMSGVEAAGLILGVLPLLISGLEYYSDGLRSLHDLFNLPEEINIFIHSLRVQHEIFKTTLISFMGPVRTSFELSELLHDPQSQSWSSTSLATSLKAQYSTSFDIYCLLLRGIYDALVQLSTIASEVKEQPAVGKTAGNAHNSTARRAYARTKFALLRSAREIPMKRFEEEIRRFTSQYEKDCYNTLHRRKWDVSNKFRSCREGASSLHNVLCQDWGCTCYSGHDVFLQLDVLDLTQQTAPKRRMTVARQDCETYRNASFYVTEDFREPSSIQEKPREILGTANVLRKGTALETFGSMKTQPPKRYMESIKGIMKPKMKKVNSGVRFEEPPTYDQAEASREEIEHICHAIHSKDDQDYVGYLKDETGCRYVHLYESMEAKPAAVTSLQGMENPHMLIFLAEAEY